MAPHPYSDLWQSLSHFTAKNSEPWVEALSWGSWSEQASECELGQTGALEPPLTSGSRGGFVLQGLMGSVGEPGLKGDKVI